MKHKSLLLTAACSAMTVFSISHAQAASDPTGVWINDTGRGAVEIKNCGKALCGHVVWVKDPNDTKGCGKQIIGEAQSVGGGVWDNGWVYSPEKRKNFDVELTPLKNGTLQVVGYMGTKLFSKTMIWTRAPADLQRCGQNESKAAPQVEAKAEEKPAPATAAAVAASAPPVAKEPVGAAKAEPEKAPVAAAPSPAPAAPTVSATAPAAAPATPAEAKAETAKPDTAAATPPAAAEPAPDQSAEANASSSDDEDTGGEKPGQRKKSKGLNLKNLRIGDLEIDKVLTKTKSGKCKLDLPWVKVVIDCEQ
jgi:uncharacterized protein (DUF2147 family)